jgi:hypothetical protein
MHACIATTGGSKSTLNLIYARTLKAMCISLESLKLTDCSFHRIVPGGANYPLGKIELDVCFSNTNNYRREKLEFEVMDWPSQYHAILGRPAFALKYPTLVTKNSTGWRKLSA